MRLSIVIPAYAEAAYIGGTIDAVHGFLTRRGWLPTTELVVVTADSNDETQAITREALRRFPHARHLEPGPKLGKGRDVRLGMLAATGEIVMFMDADLATPLDHLAAGVQAIEDGEDVVIGARDLGRIHGDWARSKTSQWANSLIQALLLPGLRDTQCGFKLFRGDIVRELFEPLAITGWGFDLEVLARARRGGYSIRELAVPDWFDPKGDDGLAGEVQWWARLRTLRDLVEITARLGRQRAVAGPRVSRPDSVRGAKRGERS